MKAQSTFGRLNTRAAYAPKIGHPDMADLWNATNQIEARLIAARRSMEEIKAWRKLSQAH